VGGPRGGGGGGGAGRGSRVGAHSGVLTRGLLGPVPGSVGVLLFLLVASTSHVSRRLCGGRRPGVLAPRLPVRVRGERGRDSPAGRTDEPRSDGGRWRRNLFRLKCPRTRRGSHSCGRRGRRRSCQKHGGGGRSTLHESHAWPSPCPSSHLRLSARYRTSRQWRRRPKRERDAWTSTTTWRRSRGAPSRRPAPLPGPFARDIGLFRAFVTRISAKCRPYRVDRACAQRNRPAAQAADTSLPGPFPATSPPSPSRILVASGPTRALPPHVV